MRNGTMIFAVLTPRSISRRTCGESLCLSGEDGQHDLAFADGLDDGLAVFFASENVARRDPTRDSLCLERGTGGIRDGVIT